MNMRDEVISFFHVHFTKSLAHQTQQEAQKTYILPIRLTPTCRSFQSAPSAALLLRQLVRIVRGLLARALQQRPVCQGTTEALRHLQQLLQQPHPQLLPRPQVQQHWVSYPRSGGGGGKGNRLTMAYSLNVWFEPCAIECWMYVFGTS